MEYLLLVSVLLVILLLPRFSRRFSAGHRLIVSLGGALVIGILLITAPKPLSLLWIPVGVLVVISLILRIRAFLADAPTSGHSTSPAGE